ncbi:amidohydrolase [Zoogloea sp.]|uniref:amidohydrolase n=1 Tax=Zoogloea sp. TaxID=49181 RepID=UPI0035B25F6C
MKSAFALRRASLAISLALAAPALLAQTQAPTRPTSPPAAAAKPAVPAVTAPAVAPAAPVAGAATAPGALPAAAGAVPIDPNAPPPAPPPPPLSDIIFTNGEVLTLDDKRPTAQAVAIKGNKIIAVGKSKDIVARWKSEGTELVDLAGKTLVPGFIDSWGQMSRMGLYSVAAQVQSPPEGKVTDTNGLLRELREWGKGDLAKRFGWIIGFGYDDTRLREQRRPSRTDLDAVSRDTPVILIHYSGSHLVANGKALELAGIGRDSIDPPGGSIGRWPGSKEPDGVLEGAAATALLGALPQLPADDRQAMIQQGQTLYLQNGYTTAVEARATPDDLALYTQAADTGALKLDVLIYADLASAGASLKGHKTIGPKYYKGHLKLAGVSFVLDGNAEDRSAWLTQPYQLPPPGKRNTFTGYPGSSDEVSGELFSRAYAGAWQVAVQANGDAAIDQFIKGLQAANTKHPGKDRRPLLAGGQTLRDDQLDTLKTLGVSLALAPRRLGLSLATLKDYALGEERTARFIPAGAAAGKGLPVLLAGDPSQIEPGPFATLAAAIKRPAGEAQQLSPLDALKALTVLPARQLGEEKLKGSIATGKLADLTVLSANPLKTPADKLGEIKVIGTVKEGVTVFGGSEGGVPILR